MATKTTRANQVEVRVCGSSTYGRYAKQSVERTLNQFISDDFLINFAGYRKVLQLFAQGQGRGIFRSIRGDFLLVVINATVYTLNSALAPTFIGILNSNNGEVYIDENLSDQICIVDGVNAYIYNHSIPPNLTVQALGGGLVPNYVTYHNTFFLFGNGALAAQGSAWYAYSYASVTTITQTTQLALQTKPDYAIAIKRIPGQSANVLVFGTAVCEVHQQIGGLLNYKRNNTISVDYGCLNVSTIDSADQYIIWLAVNEFNAPVIMMYSGQGAQQISSDGISYELGQIQYPQDSTAAFIRVDGHLMYQLTFYNPADNITYLYDVTEQKFFNLTDQDMNYHPARKYAYFNQQTYFVSLNNASVYNISTNITEINENLPGNNDPALIHDMQFIRITNTIRQDDNGRFIAQRFSFTLEQGCDPAFQALQAGELNIIDELIQNDEVMNILDENGYPLIMENNPPAFPVAYQPRVDLTISLDSGITWSNTVSYPLQPLGYRKNIINWDQLGAANEMTFKLRFWGLSRWVANKGVLEVRT